MPFLPTDAFPVDFLPDGDVEPLADVVWTGYHEDSVTIRAGRRSNLGNVPKLLRGVLPHDGAAARGFLVHDELCELQHEHQRALDAWEVAYGAIERRNQEVERAMRGHYTVLPSRPEPPPFDAVDTDAVLRVVLAELGVGPVRWVYWEGARVGALGSKARRRGFLRPRSIVPFVLLAPVAVLCVLPAAVGALVSRALLALVELLAWPWERRARAKRAATVDRVRRIARGRIAIAHASRYRCTCPPSDYEPGDHRPGCAEGKSRESAPRTGDDGAAALAGMFRAAVGGRPIVLGEPMTVEDHGERPALTGTALDRAARGYFGADYPPAHGDHPNTAALVAFRAGWRLGVDRVRAVEYADREEAPEATPAGSKSGESATRTETGEARRAAAMKAGQLIDCGALIAPLDPGPCHACRNGCPVAGGPCTPDLGRPWLPDARPAPVDDLAPCTCPDRRYGPHGPTCPARGARECLCPPGNEAPAGGDCQHPTCPRDETPGGTE